MKKASKKAMPKSISSKKNANNKSSIKFLKELNGQVIVSVEQYKAHRHLFLGTPSNNLRLKDGREVIVAVTVGDLAFDLLRVAELLLNCIFINFELISKNVNSQLTAQSYPIIARAYNFYCAIMDVMLPSHRPATLEVMRQHDEALYRLLKDEDTVKHFDMDSRDYENPENPKFRFGNKQIDAEYLAYMIWMGLQRMLGILQEETDAEEGGVSFKFTLCMGGIMVTQLRRMERRAAINYAAKELGSGSKSCVEVVFRLLTIDKEA